jgi:hypothetical protein
MKTSDIITLIANDARLSVSLRDMLKRAMIVATLIAAALFFAAIGFRTDIGAAIGTGRFLFKFVITLALAFSASLCLFRVGRPDARLGAMAWWMLAPLALAVAAAIFELFATAPETWADRMIGENSRLCLSIIPLLSIGPLLCLLFALKHGAPSRLAPAGAIAGLAAAGIAATFYAANCDDDSPLFVLLWYPIAISMVTALGAFLGHIYLRW